MQLYVPAAAASSRSIVPIHIHPSSIKPPLPSTEDIFDSEENKFVGVELLDSLMVVAGVLSRY